jgi:hypothetical protein
MLDKEFLERVKIGVDAYIKDQIYETEEIEILEEFVKWLYQQYGITYHGNP